MRVIGRKLRGVLDDEQAFGGGHAPQQGGEQRRLAGACPSRDQEGCPPLNHGAQDVLQAGINAAISYQFLQAGLRLAQHAEADAGSACRRRSKQRVEANSRAVGSSQAPIGKRLRIIQPHARHRSQPGGQLANLGVVGKANIARLQALPAIDETGIGAVDNDIGQPRQRQDRLQ